MELPRSVAASLFRLGGLRKVLGRLPEESKLKHIAGLHQTLSDPIRIRVMCALSMANLCPCILKRVTELSDSKLSYHLKVLEESGLVSSRRTRNWMIYSITPLGLKALKCLDNTE